MADAKIVDIKGVQWELKDQNARDRISVLENIVKISDLNDLELSTKNGYTASIKLIHNQYAFGKIHFAQIRIDNVAGENIGTSTTAFAFTSDIKPKKQTTFLMYDYVSSKILRCQVDPSGEIEIGESVGVTPGNNSCYGEVIWAEE